MVYYTAGRDVDEAYKSSQSDVGTKQCDPQNLPRCHRHPLRSAVIIRSNKSDYRISDDDVVAPASRCGS